MCRCKSGSAHPCSWIVRPRQEPWPTSRLSRTGSGARAPSRSTVKRMTRWSLCARGFFEGLGAVTKSRPYSVTVQVWAGEADVVVKARAYRDSDGVYLDVCRRRGDVILFMRVFRVLEKALARSSAFAACPVHSPPETAKPSRRGGPCQACVSATCAAGSCTSATDLPGHVQEAVAQRPCRESQVG